MKKPILALCLSLMCFGWANAQKVEGAATTATRTETKGTTSETQTINLETGTRLAAELQSTIDVRKARVGDEVVLKTTRAIKSNGRVVVAKGSRLIGRVTEVAQKNKGNNESRIGILFDRLENGSLSIPITATISSLTSARTEASVSNHDTFSTDSGAGASTRSTTAVGSSSSSSGLLGSTGAVVSTTTNTVGSAVGSTVSAAGTSVNSTTNAAGATVVGVGRSLRGVQITESSSASVSGGSVLSLPGENLRLEKGTNFNLVVTQSAGAGTSRDQ